MSMKDTQFYEQVLGLKAPWHVESVNLDLAKKEVTVKVKADDTAWACPECKQRMHVHEWTTRRWRHLDTCQLMTIIEADVPRVKCPQHGTQTVRVPWAEPHGRFTMMFERFAIMVMQGTNTTIASDILGISWDEADGIKARAVHRGLKRRGVQGPAKAVCIDEKAVGRGHDYITVMTRVPADGTAPYIDYIADGRSQDAVDPYWTRFETGILQEIECVSMDMWRPFIDSATEHHPRGALAIVHDPFHLCKHMNEAVDKVRRQEQSLLGPEERKELKGTRFMWLYGFENLPEKWKERMQGLKDSISRTARAWRLKERFRAFYQCENWAQAEAYFKDWYKSAIHSRLEPVMKVARMVKDHLLQILNFFIFRVTNAYSEGLNSQIQELVSRSRGYRNRTRLKLDLYFHLGNLDMMPDSHIS